MRCWQGPVLVLVIALLVTLPVSADESQGAASGNLNASRFITIDPIGDHHPGDTIAIRGLTNLSPPEELIIEAYSSSYHPGIHRNEVYESRIVKILPGGNGTTNRWSTEMATGTWRQDEYLVTATIYPGTDREVYAAVLFNLIAGQNSTAETRASVATTRSPLPALTGTPGTPAPVAPTPAAPLSAIVTPAAIGSLLMLAGMVERPGRRNREGD